MGLCRSLSRTLSHTLSRSRTLSHSLALSRTLSLGVVYCHQHSWPTLENSLSFSLGIEKLSWKLTSKTPTKVSPSKAFFSSTLNLMKHFFSINPFFSRSGSRLKIFFFRPKQNFQFIIDFFSDFFVFWGRKKIYNFGWEKKLCQSGANCKSDLLQFRVG